jgi:hypothetical protein
MALVEIKPGLVLSNKGIRSIKMEPRPFMAGTEFDIRVTYIGGNTELLPAEEISMEELLTKLGRNPRAKGRTDSP